MKFTDLFVRRPVLALVISALILMLGLFAIKQLPIREYPLLESSTITIATTYPGASAELMQGFVTQPIAQAVSSVEGIDYLTSSSVQGSSNVTVRMELNRDSTRRSPKSWPRSTRYATSCRKALSTLSSSARQAIPRPLPMWVLPATAYQPRS